MRFKEEKKFLANFYKSCIKRWILSFVSLSFLLPLSRCSEKQESVFPITRKITESVYASGIVKSEGQYQAFSAVNGIVQEIFVKEGDILKINDPILEIAGDAVVLSKEDALLEQRFAAENVLGESLKDLNIQIDIAKTKMENDALLLERQKNLWKNSSGTLNDLEQREINSRNSTAAYQSLLLKHKDLKRQLMFNADHSSINLQMKSAVAAEYVIRSHINGRVYDLLKEPGELVTSQSPIALIGDANSFLIELQVDENDITRIRSGQRVLIRMDSYKGKIFDAVVRKVSVLMSEDSRSFKVEAKFLKQPEILYPNLTAEANIIIQSSNSALLIPRNYVMDDKYVILINGKRREIKTGLKDYRQIQILSGLKANEEILKPLQ